jgi:hypothetical protein
MLVYSSPCRIIVCCKTAPSREQTLLIHRPLVQSCDTCTCTHCKVCLKEQAQLTFKILYLPPLLHMACASRL